ncbi:hypothetical protein PGH12_16600 [Chryseobacterium wangxinyae]|uniref:hypothetical protein n=1 Tax=Chryseobacterium sp. CY350 TaxID=2997336 RepID=UPI00226F06A9|nr:hypothetical protein [Chryseobacterium sp. CY350]MCY0977977.1 hypothetical protein [Chryseobacterium sp. CY350]WBZ95064.1 hypothetical protein PGH12_16600 [Chryseobacterium sp. CY350]
MEKKEFLKIIDDNKEKMPLSIINIVLKDRRKERIISKKVAFSKIHKTNNYDIIPFYKPTILL